MANCLAVKDYAAVLGKTAITDWAMQLDVVPVAPSLALRHGQWWQFNQLSEIEPGLPLPARLVALLRTLWPQLSTAPAAAPVLLVLPEQLAGEQMLAEFISALQQEFPSLLSHAACQLFPYGSSAALLALATARQLLDSGAPVIWLIALDSPVANAMEQAAMTRAAAKVGQDADYSENLETEQIVWSEAAVAMALTQSDTGLRCHYLASDATVSTETDELAIGNLFDGASANTDGPLSWLYLADNGSSATTACWQPHYPRLAPVIDAATQLSFPAYFTGELGAAGGVYRLLHLYLGYLNAGHRGFTLQCEISQRLYRAVAVFSWQQASNISDS